MWTKETFGKAANEMNVVELTDAIGLAESAALLDTTPRAIYTIRHTRVISYARMVKLMDMFKADEKSYREQMAYKLRLQAERDAVAANSFRTIAWSS
jgi:hypothetical protein